MDKYKISLLIKYNNYKKKMKKKTSEIKPIKKTTFACKSF